MPCQCLHRSCNRLPLCETESQCLANVSIRAAVPNVLPIYLSFSETLMYLSCSVMPMYPCYRVLPKWEVHFPVNLSEL